MNCPVCRWSQWIKYTQSSFFFFKKVIRANRHNGRRIESLHAFVGWNTGLQSPSQSDCFQLCPPSPPNTPRECSVLLLPPGNLLEISGELCLTEVMIYLYFCLLHQGGSSRGQGLNPIHLWVPSAPAEHWAHSSCPLNSGNDNNRNSNNYCYSTYQGQALLWVLDVC